MGSANIYNSLSPMITQISPTPSQRKKRFAKIREKIEGKR